MSNTRRATILKSFVCRALPYRLIQQEFRSMFPLSPDFAKQAATNVGAQNR